jgi:hypothetical protein
MGSNPITVTVSLSAYDDDDPVTVTVSLSACSDNDKFESVSISAVGSNLASSVRERLP